MAMRKVLLFDTFYAPIVFSCEDHESVSFHVSSVANAITFSERRFNTGSLNG